ncbi:MULTISPECIES: I78 family peptidase inhibitor [unclassified Sphingopyxis]|jgi:hypothetical protein|uniref:I78 family peptidase inhibitor n=1 Tax=unclassified Sphingopyxis TaxID=2614943 RepID=UPI0007303526|nr:MULTISPECIES: I78 family peptidase inhibitor [unclassified Sphingopyxis]KTE25160.1 hypothetical protein ATE61_11700 [Sphingopyxis sp. H057]KTE53730.1 hypothetical protein ATE64_07655 [Sphingopyxis sp. H073]KTE56322.1 hypothetical protein ATE69_07640 [Sphingopyxis sp. H071]KTE62015.1 hypothetical protein ATE66_04495 [Sphingopyxis sp. H107]KTE67287.1 hypothetical protein ATE65_04500 [Sphingopyxis sp. H100]
MLRQLGAAGLALSALGGCASTQIPDGDACGASALQRFVGRDFGSAIADGIARRTYGGLGEQAVRRSKRSVRTIRPGDTLVANYDPHRVNVSIDESNTITAIQCF